MAWGPRSRGTKVPYVAVGPDDKTRAELSAGARLRSVSGQLTQAVGEIREVGVKPGETDSKGPCDTRRAFLAMIRADTIDQMASILDERRDAW